MMLDWFILLTPFLVSPIALLLLYVGCVGEITNVDWVEGKFAVSFFLAASRIDNPQIEDHVFQFRIIDPVHGEVTTDSVSFQDLVELQEGVGGKATRLQHQFKDFIPQGQASYTCQVIDLFDQDTLVAGGVACDLNLEVRERYLIAYSALVSDDGIEPDSAFSFCDDDLL